jgi:hypothetical protein
MTFEYDRFPSAHRDSLDVEVGVAHAAKYFTISADQENQVAYGFALRHGDGASKNLVEVLKCFKPLAYQVNTSGLGSKGQRFCEVMWKLREYPWPNTVTHSDGTTSVAPFVVVMMFARILARL